MTEFSGAPLPPLPPAPKKNNTWLIVLVVILVLCCCCFGVIGLLVGFGEDILNEINNYFGLVPLLAAVI
ncbi:MAG: hypothetical protein QMD04_12555 [Anaerolineales bacterium]|nr:hypothetical protein [Anaerolineales bacterium]